MTKRELIEAMEGMPEDYVVIIGDRESGWCNIGGVKIEGCCVSIMEDYSRPFSSD